MDSTKSNESPGKEIQRLQTQLAEYQEYYKGQTELFETELARRIDLEKELADAN